MPSSTSHSIVSLMGLQQHNTICHKESYEEEAESSYKYGIISLCHLGNLDQTIVGQLVNHDEMDPLLSNFHKISHVIILYPFLPIEIG